MLNNEKKKNVTRVTGKKPFETSKSVRKRGSGGRRGFYLNMFKTGLYIKKKKTLKRFRSQARNVLCFEMPFS